MICGVYDRYPERAREILRERIYTSYEPSLLEREMVKLSAKRLSVEAPPARTSTEVISFPPLRLEKHPSLGKKITTEQSEKLALEMASPEQDQRDLPLHERDRAVGAVLVDQTGTLLAVARNQNAKNKTLHAEYILARGFFEQTGQLIPEGAKVFVTLSPCRMCAAALSEYSQDRVDLQVFYQTKDPGLLAQNICLRHSQMWDELT